MASITFDDGRLVKSHFAYVPAWVGGYVAAFGTLRHKDSTRSAAVLSRPIWKRGILSPAASRPGQA